MTPPGFEGAPATFLDQCWHRHIVESDIWHVVCMSFGGLCMYKPSSVTRRLMFVRSEGSHTADPYSIPGLTRVLYAVSFSDCGQLRRFLSRMANLEWAWPTSVLMWVFHCMCSFMDTPRYLVSVTLSRRCPPILHGIHTALRFWCFVIMCRE